MLRHVGVRDERRHGLREIWVIDWIVFAEGWCAARTLRPEQADKQVMPGEGFLRPTLRIQVLPKYHSRERQHCEGYEAAKPEPLRLLEQPSKADEKGLWGLVLAQSGRFKPETLPEQLAHGYVDLQVLVFSADVEDVPAPYK
jgi:hypothetical protein